jgi:Domain of unknown function (DUF4382)/Domain of unknown function (DUF5666)
MLPRDPHHSAQCPSSQYGSPRMNNTQAEIAVGSGVRCWLEIRGRRASRGRHSMKALQVFILLVTLVALAGCGGGASSVSNPVPQQGTAQVSVSLHDMPPAGVSVLSFQATVTGISMQPGGVSLLNSPMALEMTQLQAVSAYMGTISVPAGNYTGMTVTLTNPEMTFLNTTGGTIGGMMGGSTCANGQVCQLIPTMMASSVNITGSPFPLTVQANTPLNLQMDFDLMDSLQSNMSMNPLMTSTMSEAAAGSNMLDEMDDMIGQVGSVDSSNNQLKVSFVQGMPSIMIGVDGNTTFQDFDSIGKANNISGLAQGQIVLVRMQLMAGGILRAAKVRFESNNTDVMDGIIVAVKSPAQFDMVMTNEAAAFQGVSIGDVVRMNLEVGTMFDIDDMDMPVSGMSFAAASDMMIGQTVQIEPTSALVPGTPPQLNTNHMRLMKAWITAKVASKVDATTFTVNNLPGVFSTAGITAMKIATSTQTTFEGVTGAPALNVGDTVSVRGPMFMASGIATIVASKVERR